MRLRWDDAPTRSSARSRTTLPAGLARRHPGADHRHDGHLAEAVQWAAAACRYARGADLGRLDPQLRDRKIDQLASVIAAMNTGQGPDLLGVCEVENRSTDSLR